MEETLNNLQTRFAATDVARRRENLAFASVPRERAVEAITWLRDVAGFGHLVMISTVDRIERGVFQIVYLLRSHERRCDIGLRVEIGRERASMESIHHLWAAAQVYQREIKEMYGIDFPGSPRVDEPMILEGWDDMPPMRRDFDTRAYAERTFFPREGRTTEDPADALERRVYPIEARVKRETKRIVRGDDAGHGDDTADKARSSSDGGAPGDAKDTDER
jgi:NADH-quinone oxidoreductase subunit C